MFGITGENYPMFGKIGENLPFFGKIHSEGTKAKMSVANGSIIYVYDKESTLINTFNSARKAAKYLIVIIQQL